MDYKIGFKICEKSQSVFQLISLFLLFKFIFNFLDPMNDQVLTEISINNQHISTQCQIWKTLQQRLSAFLADRSSKFIQSDQNSTHSIYTINIEPTVKKQAKIKIKRSQNGCSFYLSTPLNCHKEKVNSYVLNQTINKFNRKCKIPNSKIYFKNNSGCGAIIFYCNLRRSMFEASEFSEYRSIIDEYLKNGEAEFIEFHRQIQTKSEKQPKQKLKQIRERITSLQKLIEHQIRTRKQNTIPAQNNGYQIDLNQPNTKINAIKSQYDTGKLSSLEQFQQLYKKDIEEYEKHSEDFKILTTVEILSKKQDRLWEVPDSAYGRIKKWNIEFIVDEESSFFSEANQLIIQYRNNVPEKLYGEIIEKTIKDTKNKDCIESFQTEKAILKYLRNSQEITIASNFAQKSADQLSSLYTQFYPMKLCEKEYSFKEAIKIISYLAKAINFLQNQHVLHRDLKPDNIMLSRKMIPKIIDFGSAYITTDSIFNEEISQTLRTSKHYNLFPSSTNYEYGDAKKFQTHPNYDVFAFGVIAKEIMGNIKREGSSSNGLKNFDFLYKMATRHNPQDRPNGKHLLLYTILLVKDFQFFQQAFP